MTLTLGLVMISTFCTAVGVISLLIGALLGLELNVLLGVGLMILGLLGTLLAIGTQR